MSGGVLITGGNPYFTGSLSCYRCDDFYENILLQVPSLNRVNSCELLSRSVTRQKHAEIELLLFLSSL